MFKEGDEGGNRKDQPLKLAKVVKVIHLNNEEKDLNLFAQQMGEAMVYNTNDIGMRTMVQ